MSVHLQWRLICRLFATGRSVRFQSFAPTERALLSSLGHVIKPAVVGSSDVLCSYCEQHSVIVMAGAQGGREGYCPDCGPIELLPEDFRSYALDDAWMQRNLRLALDIQSRDGTDELAEGMWRLGDARRSPVVLSRSLLSIWRRPDVLERVRVAGQQVRLITPVRRDVHGMPFGYDVEWLPLEERFALYGGGITAIGVGVKPLSTHLAEPEAFVDPTLPVHGPFSEDFRWVTVPEIQEAPIQLTRTQAAIFKALWAYRGRPCKADRLMDKAGSNSAKPSDLFKGERYRLAREAYHALVAVDSREGMYVLRCC